MKRMKPLIVLLSVLFIAGQVSASDVDLINGDLETGDRTGWTFVLDYNYFTNEKGEVVPSLGTDPPGNGNYVYEGNDYYEMVSAASDVWQADTTYTVSLDIWRDPAAGVTPFIAVNPADNDAPWSGWNSGDPWRFGIGGGGDPLPDGWTTQSIEFTTGGAGEPYVGETIQLGLQIWSNSNEYWTRLDNLAMVPEPATMCLLGLGGLLLRRKKV